MLGPRDLARAYDRHIAAQWRGTPEEVSRFEVWIASHWTTEAPPQPRECPDDVSLAGGSARAVLWYADRDAVLGYLPGRPLGCYRVPLNSVLPDAAAPPRQPAALAEALS